MAEEKRSFGKYKGLVDCQIPAEMADEILRISVEELDIALKSLIDSANQYDLEVHFGWHEKEAIYQAYVEGVEPKKLYYGMRLRATGDTIPIAIASLYVKMDMRLPDTWQTSAKRKKLKGGIS